MARTVIGLAMVSWRPILGGEFPVAGLARLTGEVFDQVVGYCAARCAGPYVQTIKGLSDGVRVDLDQAAYIAP